MVFRGIDIIDSVPGAESLISMVIIIDNIYIPLA